MKNKTKRSYTKAHRKAFRKVEKELTGRNTIRGYFHDIDKLFLYLFFDYNTVHNWHRKHSTRNLELSVASPSLAQAGLLSR